MDNSKLSEMSYRELIALRTEIANAITEIEDNALNQLTLGESVPDFVLSHGPSRRVVTDEKALVASLKKNGFTNKDLYTAKMVGIPAIEKLCEGAMIPFSKVAEPFIEKKEGKPKLKYVGKV